MNRAEVGGIKQKAWVILFSLKQKTEFKDEASIHILLICRLPDSSDFFRS